jgi:formylglycine-generating enzyme required for sulfatase activity
MVLIPAGNFQMGRDGGENDEAPAHTVFLDAFYIDRYEVTNEMYLSCDQSGVCSKPVDVSGLTEGDYESGKYPDYPVVNVGWDMAKTYCAWRGARLPTEAEWEKAARGGLTGMRYPWGNETPTCNIGARNGAQFGECPKDRTVKVGSFAANGYGVYDMVGNVWEWVGDWYQQDYYLSSSGMNNPQGPSFGSEKILRGGSWKSRDFSLVNRSPVPPETLDYEIGFRCAGNATP